MLPASLAAGAVAGLIATAPMTAAMELLHRRLVVRHRYALPPRWITERVLRAAGLCGQADEDERRALTLGAHFGYGAAAGALYGAVARALRPPAVPAGIAFGLLVWTVSYLGLPPLTGLFRPATDDPAPRNALMLAAHVVWGTVLGAVTDRLDSGR